MYKNSGGSWLTALIMILVKQRHISPWITALRAVNRETLPMWLFTAEVYFWSTLHLAIWLLTLSALLVSIFHLTPHIHFHYRRNPIIFHRISSFSVFPFLWRVPNGFLGDNYACSSGTWSKHQIWHGKMQEGKLKCQARKFSADIKEREWSMAVSLLAWFLSSYRIQQRGQSISTTLYCSEWLTHIWDSGLGESHHTKISSVVTKLPEKQNKAHRLSWLLLST